MSAVVFVAVSGVWAGPSSGLSDPVLVAVGSSSSTTESAVSIVARYRSALAAIGSTRLYTTEIPGLSIFLR